MLVVDASVVVAADDLGDPHHPEALAVLEGDEPLATVDLCAWELANVAITSWHNPVAAVRLVEHVWLIERSGLLVRVEAELLADARTIAAEYGIIVYDAAYVAAARRLGARLVSCDVRDLVSRGLADLPTP